MDHDGLHPDSPLMTMSNSFLGDGMLSLSIPGPSRDPVYYIPDGNSVLLVENTLFKVRFSPLSRRYDRPFAGYTWRFVLFLSWSVRAPFRRFDLMIYVP